MPIIKALLDRGAEVFIIVPQDEYAQKLQALDLPFKLVFYEFSRSSLNPFIILKNFLHLKAILKPLNLDLLQTNAHKSNTFGIMAAKCAKIKRTVCLVEGLGSFYIEDDFKSRAVRSSINALYKISFKLADKFIFVSDANANFMRNLGLKEEKIAVIKSVGVNLRHFYPFKISQAQKKHFLREIKANASLPVVLMVSRALWHKGIKEFYEAANLLKNRANFLLVGGLDKHNKSCVPLNFLQNGAVFYLGERSDIAFLLNLCDIFVLPSYKEGFPQALLEAKACGKPYVVSEVEGCVEAVKNAIDGLYCEVKNASDLADKISLLLEDKQLRLNLGHNAFKDALNYDENSIAQRYLALYDSLFVK